MATLLELAISMFFFTDTKCFGQAVGVALRQPTKNDLIASPLFFLFLHLLIQARAFFFSNCLPG
jgi:hypothetical protein